MRVRLLFLARLLAIGIAFVTGCGAPAFAQSGGKSLVLYVLTYQPYPNDTIAIYDLQSGAAVGAITPDASTSALAVGNGGELYLLESVKRPTAAEYVAAYPSGSTTPTLQIPTQKSAFGIAVSDTGELAVAGQGNLQIYAAGSTKPERSLETNKHEPFEAPVYGLGGGLWIPELQDPRDHTIHYLPPGASDFADVRLETALPRVSPQLVVDRNGDLLVLEGAVVNVYGGKSGKRFFSVPIAGNFSLVTAMALAPDDRHLIVATIDLAGGRYRLDTDRTTISVFRYPEGGSPISTFDVPGTYDPIAVGMR